VLEKATIKFLTKVSKINSPKEAEGKVVITTVKDEAFEFDEIVVTAPLGWLKQNQEAFTPSLPPRFSSAIESIGYGCLEKVTALFGPFLQRKYHIEITNELRFSRSISVSRAPSGSLLPTNKFQTGTYTQISQHPAMNSPASLISCTQITPPLIHSTGYKKSSK
jgi:hypothetical protein